MIKQNESLKLGNLVDALLRKQIYYDIDKIYSHTIYCFEKLCRRSAYHLIQQLFFNPQPLRLWGIVITREGRAGGQKFSSY